MNSESNTVKWQEYLIVLSKRAEVKGDWEITTLLLPNLTAFKEKAKPCPWDTSCVCHVPQTALPELAKGRPSCCAPTFRILTGCSFSKASGTKSGPHGEPALFDISTGQEQTHWWWQTILWSSPATWRGTQIWSHLTTRSFTDLWKGYIIFKFCCEKYVGWAFINPKS